MKSDLIGFAPQHLRGVIEELRVMPWLICLVGHGVYFV